MLKKLVLFQACFLTAFLAQGMESSRTVTDIRTKMLPLTNDENIKKAEHLLKQHQAYLDEAFNTDDPQAKIAALDKAIDALLEVEKLGRDTNRDTHEGKKVDFAQSCCVTAGKYATKALVEQDPQKRAYFIEQRDEWNLNAAERGEKNAQYNVAVGYRQKCEQLINEVEKAECLHKTLDWFTKAASQGHVDAQNSLGSMLCEYAETITDRQQKARIVAEAVRWLFEAGRRGHEQARSILQMAMNKYYISINSQEATRKKVEDESLARESAAERLAAEKGEKNAQYSVAVGYLRKIYQTISELEKAGYLQKALDWFEKAARQGHENAQNCLSSLLYERAKTIEDLDQKTRIEADAARWHFEAVRNHREAAKKDEKKKAKEGWRKFVEEAEKGEKNSQYMAAIGYLEKREESTSEQEKAEYLQQALGWLEKAAHQGHENAPYCLANLLYELAQTIEDPGKKARMTADAVRWLFEAGAYGSKKSIGQLADLYLTKCVHCKDLEGKKVYLQLSEECARRIHEDERDYQDYLLARFRKVRVDIQVLEEIANTRERDAKTGGEAAESPDDVARNEKLACIRADEDRVFAQERTSGCSHTAPSICEHCAQKTGELMYKPAPGTVVHLKTDGSRAACGMVFAYEAQLRERARDEDIDRVQAEAEKTALTNINMKDLHFEDGHLSDHELLVEFAIDSNDFYQTRRASREYARMVFDIWPETYRSGVIKILKHRDEVVGFFTLIFYRDIKFACRLGHLFVKPGLQRRGLGSHLFREMVSIARARGCKTVCFFASPDARDFYLKKGCEIVEHLQNSLNPAQRGLKCKYKLCHPETQNDPRCLLDEGDKTIRDNEQKAPINADAARWDFEAARNGETTEERLVCTARKKEEKHCAPGPEITFGAQLRPGPESAFSEQLRIDTDIRRVKDHAEKTKLPNVNLKDLYFENAEISQREFLIEFAIDSNDIYGTRTASREYTRMVFNITPETFTEGVVKILKHRDEIVGVFALEFEPNNISTCKLKLFFVKAGLQRKGLGSYMFKEMVSMARARGFTNIFFVASFEAKDFCLKKGCDLVGSHPNCLSAKECALHFIYSLT